MAELKYVFKPDKYSGHSRILRLVKTMSSKPNRILDVGTAQGYLGRELSAAGHSVCGIEQDAEWAAAAQLYYCEPIQVGDLDVLEPRYPEKYFDVIILGAVLEHLKNPDHVLIRLCRCLKDGGKVVISIPNVANWYIRLQLLLGRFDYEDRGIMDRTHLRFYTWKTFQQLLRDCQLRIIHHEISPIPLPIVFPITAEGRSLYFCHVINNAISNIRKSFFAFEFIVVSDLKQPQ